MNFSKIFNRLTYLITLFASLLYFFSIDIPSSSPFSIFSIINIGYVILLVIYSEIFQASKIEIVINIKKIVTCRIIMFVVFSIILYQLFNMLLLYLIIPAIYPFIFVAL